MVFEPSRDQIAVCIFHLIGFFVFFLFSSKKKAGWARKVVQVVETMTSQGGCALHGRTEPATLTDVIGAAFACSYSFLPECTAPMERRDRTSLSLSLRPLTRADASESFGPAETERKLEKKLDLVAARGNKCGTCAVRYENRLWNNFSVRTAASGWG